MIKKLLLFVSLSLITFITASAEGLEAVYGKVSNGYNYWLYTPEDTADENGKPLVIFLHGRSLCGSDLNKVRKYGTISAIEKGRKLDAYVIAPQNPGGSWNPEKIMNIVEYVSEENNIDENRIYVLGMSLGGYGAIDFAAAYPDRIAAAIGMCGGATKKDLSGLATMPLWIIHGTGDAAVPVSQSDKVVEAVKAAQTDGVNRLQYDRVPGMNHSKPARVFYHPDTYEWLFSHSLADEGRPMTPTFKINEEFFGSCYSNLNHSRGYKGSNSQKATASKGKSKSKTTTASTKSTTKKSKSSSKTTASATSKKSTKKKGA